MPDESTVPAAIELRSFDLLPLGLCLLDGRMIVRCWNQTLESWTGLRRERVLGRPYGEGFESFSLLPLRERIEGVLAGKASAEIVCPLHAVFTAPQAGDQTGRASGGGLMMHRTTVRRWDETGEYALVVIEDVTTEFQQIQDLLAERKTLRATMRRLEDQSRSLEQSRNRIEAQAAAMQSQAAELEVARRRAEQANQAKSEFLANMSHEIRTPITAVLGFADVLLTEDGAEAIPPERRNALETIKRNGEHLLEIINDILDVSKIEASCITVERIRFSPAKIVADVVGLMRMRAEAQQLEFKVAYVGTIPETIESDPTRLRQILLNLVGNALKFTEAGGVQIDVRFLADGSGSGQLEFAVSDSGIGMTEEQLGRLFRPFTQADASTTRKFGGTGLGLTISKRLAELLDGSLAVKSQPGKGSTFTAAIRTGPLAGIRMIQPTPPAAILPKPPTASSEKRLLGCRILIAEDGPDNQTLLSFLLKKGGAQVTIVEHGLAAVEAAQRAQETDQPFDLVLMDMQMPVMDGYTATTRLRQAGYRGGIIALTAYSMGGDREKCLQSGCDDYVAKPIEGPKLISLIARRLQASRSSELPRSPNASAAGCDEPGTKAPGDSPVVGTGAVPERR